MPVAHSAELPAVTGVLVAHGSHWLLESIFILPLVAAGLWYVVDRWRGRPARTGAGRGPSGPSRRTRPWKP